MLQRDFYMRDANLVAHDLLGKKLTRCSADGITSGIIVEVEAYVGPNDKGAHAYGNLRTPRTEIQFGPGGYAYVYLVYGMYCCFNVVTNDPGKPEVVLVRALEPIVGVDIMRARRGADSTRDLCSGPGKLCIAMNITKENYGDDLCGSALFIEEGRNVPRREIATSPRVNIDYAEECKNFYWRYYILDNPYVSNVPKRYRGVAAPSL